MGRREGEGGGGSEMRRETLRLGQRRDLAGGLAAGARRPGGRRSRESVRGGRCRRLLSSLRQEQLRAAAGSSGHGGGGGGGSSLQIPGSGSSTAPHTPGTWEPSNRFRPSGAPSPVHGTSAAALPPLASARCLLRKCPRFAPSPEPCQRLWDRLLLASFLPSCLPSFVTRPGRRRQRRRQHKPAFARVRGCSV